MTLIGRRLKQRGLNEYHHGLSRHSRIAPAVADGPRGGTLPLSRPNEAICAAPMDCAARFAGSGGPIPGGLSVPLPEYGLLPGELRKNHPAHFCCTRVWSDGSGPIWPLPGQSILDSRRFDMSSERVNYGLNNICSVCKVISQSICCLVSHSSGPAAGHSCRVYNTYIISP